MPDIAIPANMQEIQVSDLLDNPEYYLYALENEEAVFLVMNRESYARSIFFDQRISPKHDHAIRVPLTALRPAAAVAPSPRIGWIFHMAHTGSTLLARALDQPGRNLVIREPVTLRALGVEAGAVPVPGDSWHENLNFVLAMLGRRFAADQPVVVKANVPVNVIITDVLARSADTKALLLHFGMEDYLIAILRSDNHRKWVDRIFEEVCLGRHFGTGGVELQNAEKAAALWLFQIRQYADVLADNSGVRSLDANILFDEPRLCLMAASDYLGCAIGEKEARNIVSGDLFSTYSKNPNASFDNALRKTRMAETRTIVGAEITLARRWVEARLAESPLPERLSRPLCGENSRLF